MTSPASNTTAPLLAAPITKDLFKGFHDTANYYVEENNPDKNKMFVLKLYGTYLYEKETQSVTRVEPNDKCYHIYNKDFIARDFSALARGISQLITKNTLFSADENTLFIGLGRSPFIVTAALESREYSVLNIPCSGLQGIDNFDNLKNIEQLFFKSYFSSYLSRVKKSYDKIAIIDYADTGHSLGVARKVISSVKDLPVFSVGLHCNMDLFKSRSIEPRNYLAIGVSGFYSYFCLDKLKVSSPVRSINILKVFREQDLNSEQEATSFAEQLIEENEKYHKENDMGQEYELLVKVYGSLPLLSDVP